MEDVDELRRLPPEKRIGKLKEREEAHRKEIEEAEELIRESHREISKIERKKRLPVESMTAETFDQLFTEEEKQMLETKRFLHRPAVVREPGEQKKTGEEETLEDVAAGAPEKNEPGFDYKGGMDAGKGKSPMDEAYQRSTVTGRDEDEMQNLYESGAVESRDKQKEVYNKGSQSVAATYERHDEEAEERTSRIYDSAP